MQPGRVAHLDDDVARQRAHALQNALGHARLVARHHDDGHRLAHRAPHAQHNPRQNTALRGGHDGGIHAALVRRAQRQRALVIARRHGAQRGLDHADDRRQNHHRQQDRRGEHRVAAAVPSFAERAHRGHEHHNAEKTVDHRRNPRQQLHRGLEHAIQPLRAEERQINRRQQRHRHAQQQRARRHVYAAHNHRENAVDIRAGLPPRAGKEFQHADFPHRGQAVGQQKRADQRHAQHGYARRRQKDIFHHALQQRPFFVASLHIITRQKTSTAAPSPSGNRLGSGRMFFYFIISFHFVASPRKMEAICSTVISSVGFSRLTITAMPSIAMA